jgi:hypothetical protein
MKTNNFDEWSKWYDIIYEERIKELPEIEFYTRNFCRKNLIVNL